MVRTQNGLMYLKTSSSARNIIGDVINTKAVSADSIQEKNGRIYLVASFKARHESSLNMAKGVKYQTKIARLQN